MGRWLRVIIGRRLLKRGEFYFPFKLFWEGESVDEVIDWGIFVGFVNEDNF